MSAGEGREPGARPAAIVVASYALAWSVACWPALRTAWWATDDYGQDEVSTAASVAHHLGQGRPGQLAWMATLLLDHRGRSLPNLALRAAQGALHVLAAALAAGLLWRETSRAATLVAGLPFLLWPFGTEAVLWRSAGTYPVAACASLAAAWLVRGAVDERGRRWLAAGLVVAAVLTVQLAAFAGAVVWLLAASIACATGAADKTRRRREALWLGSAYVVGAGASWLIAEWAAHGVAERLRVVRDVPGKVAFVRDAVGFFLTEPSLYPRWLIVVQALSVASLVLVPLLGRRAPRRSLLLAALGVGAALVTPYAALLPVAESHLSWRALYLAPLFFGGAFALAEWALAGRVAGLAVSGLFLLLVLGDLRLSRVVAAAYPAVFQADRRVLAGADAKARAEGVARLAVWSPEGLSVGSGNPHHIPYAWGAASSSALLQSWTAPHFVAWFSSLEPVPDGEARAACGTHEAPTETAFSMEARRAQGLLCLWPPAVR